MGGDYSTDRRERITKMKVKELLSSPDKWTKGATARDTYGLRVFTKDKNAVCWCLVGATIKCYCSCTNTAADPNCKVKEIYEKINEKIDTTITIWNDSPERTFEDVKKLVEELDI